MFNLLRAAFWIAVVAYFMPSNPVANAINGQTHRAVAVLGDGRHADVRVADAALSPELNARVHSAAAYQDVASVCGAQPDLCSASVKAVDQAQDLAVQGLGALADALDEKKPVKTARD